MQLQSRLRFSRLLWSFTGSPDLTPYPGGRKRGRFGSHRRCVVLSSWRLGLARRMAWRNPLLRLGASRVGRALVPLACVSLRMVIWSDYFVEA